MLMSHSEYIVSFGAAGDFARFRAEAPLACRRGDRVIIRHEQGLDLGTVLCPATEGHNRFLSQTAVGALLRLATRDDWATNERCRDQAEALFQTAQQTAQSMALPLTIVDVTISFDARRATIAYLRNADCDFRPLVSSLSRTFALTVEMQNLSPALVEEHEHGCGKPDCGQREGGGCTSCGSGGCGTCSAGAKPEDIGRMLASLAGAAESPRTSLL